MASTPPRLISRSPQGPLSSANCTPVAPHANPLAQQTPSPAGSVGSAVSGDFTPLPPTPREISDPLLDLAYQGISKLFVSQVGRPPLQGEIWRLAQGYCNNWLQGRKKSANPAPLPQPASATETPQRLPDPLPPGSPYRSPSPLRSPQGVFLTPVSRSSAPSIRSRSPVRNPLRRSPDGSGMESSERTPSPIRSPLFLGGTPDLRSSAYSTRSRAFFPSAPSVDNTTGAVFVFSPPHLPQSPAVEADRSFVPRDMGAGVSPAFLDALPPLFRVPNSVPTAGPSFVYRERMAELARSSALRTPPPQSPAVMHASHDGSPLRVVDIGAESEDKSPREGAISPPVVLGASKPLASTPPNSFPPPIRRVRWESSVRSPSSPPDLGEPLVEELSRIHGTPAGGALVRSPGRPRREDADDLLGMDSQFPLLRSESPAHPRLDEAAKIRLFSALDEQFRSFGFRLNTMAVTPAQNHIRFEIGRVGHPSSMHRSPGVAAVRDWERASQQLTQQRYTRSHSSSPVRMIDQTPAPAPLPPPHPALPPDRPVFWTPVTPMNPPVDVSRAIGSLGRKVDELTRLLSEERQSRLRASAPLPTLPIVGAMPSLESQSFQKTVPRPPAAKPNAPLRPHPAPAKPTVTAAPRPVPEKPKVAVVSHPVPAVASHPANSHNSFPLRPASAKPKVTAAPRPVPEKPKVAVVSHPVPAVASHPANSHNSFPLRPASAKPKVTAAPRPGLRPANPRDMFLSRPSAPAKSKVTAAPRPAPHPPSRPQFHPVSHVPDPLFSSLETKDIPATGPKKVIPLPPHPKFGRQPLGSAISAGSYGEIHKNRVVVKRSSSNPPPRR